MRRLPPLCSAVTHAAEADETSPRLPFISPANFSPASRAKMADSGFTRPSDIISIPGEGRAMSGPIERRRRHGRAGGCRG